MPRIQTVDKDETCFLIHIFIWLNRLPSSSQTLVCPVFKMWLRMEHVSYSYTYLIKSCALIVTDTVSLILTSNLETCHRRQQESFGDYKRRDINPVTAIQAACHSFLNLISVVAERRNRNSRLWVILKPYFFLEQTWQKSASYRHVIYLHLLFLQLIRWLPLTTLRTAAVLHGVSRLHRCPMAMEALSSTWSLSEPDSPLASKSIGNNILIKKIALSSFPEGVAPTFCWF